MIRFVLCLTALVFAATGARAQTPAPNDSVTVTAEQLREQIERYLGSVTTHAAMAGKIARWERHAICPVAVGLKPQALSFVTERIRAVAREVGAPVAPDANCRPNIRVVFTTEPQALLDNVRKKNWGLLGYARTHRDADRMAHVSRPVQGWYVTETLDWLGRPKRDSLRLICYEPSMLDCPVVHQASPFRTASGQDSQFEHAMVVVDPTKLGDPEMGTLADVIAMLALSQPQLDDACRGSVLDLAAGCATPPDGLSAMDMSYLRSLYSLRGLNVGMQIPLAARMEQHLKEKAP